MISAVSCAISLNTSSVAGSGRLAQRARASSAVSTMTGAKCGRREVLTIGATVRRRWRQVSPSLTNNPSPSSGTR
jgi:hypothetical protein